MIYILYLSYNNNNLNISKNTFISAFQFPSRFSVENISCSKHQPLYPPLRKMNGSIHGKQKSNRNRNLAFIFRDTKRTGAYRSRLLSRNIEPRRSNALSQKYRIEHLSDEGETKNSGKLLEKTFGGGRGEMATGVRIMKIRGGEKRFEESGSVCKKATKARNYPRKSIGHSAKKGWNSWDV